MHMKLTKISPQWYRVLEISNVYREEREAYDKKVTIVNNVHLLSERNLVALNSALGNRSSNGYSVINPPAVEKDYTQQVFLTNTEFKNFFAHVASNFTKEHDRVQFYIDRGFGYDYNIVMYRTAEINYTGNIYKDATPTMDVIHNLKLEKITTNVFDTQAEKDAFLKNESKTFTTAVVAKMKGK